ncbi:flagellar basal body P-ring formation chaperone FlgA [Sphingomonas sp. NIBR02145]|uniref:flagellar basal body P-ring formation chaperone FlgA n=1 Tax=Sphingomonas sp. NIBR02145 TaxID=3014784 RepID=UPI0022B4050B|nr:flagellar basal body P-ring formation chaperone FlgA [Sphingomonas sp. NIBR02145]WHU04777.1 flagellar basal body P-ring formation chaperone FlgA [Sphingomonas sp. NIBR02145]
MLNLLGLALLAFGSPEDVPVAVLGHAVQKGDRIEAGDFSVEQRPAASARGALTIDQAAGMEAARNLPAGTVVRQADLMRPQMVRRGEPVTIRIVSGPLIITAAGRALAGGSKGEAVRVVANATNRTLDGVVEASGTVRIVTP